MWKKLLAIVLVFSFVNFAYADFTPQEETILKAAAEKIKCEYQLKKLEKQRKNLGNQMNAEMKVERDTASAAIVIIRDTYDPQLVDLDNQIEAKKDELENLL